MGKIPFHQPLKSVLNPEYFHSTEETSNRRCFNNTIDSRCWPSSYKNAKCRCRFTHMWLIFLCGISWIDWLVTSRSGRKNIRSSFEQKHRARSMMNRCMGHTAMGESVKCWAIVGTHQNQLWLNACDIFLNDR